MSEARMLRTRTQSIGSQRQIITFLRKLLLRWFIDTTGRDGSNLNSMLIEMIYALL